MNAEEMAEYVRKLVDDCPPLTDAQRDRISALLRPPTDGESEDATVERVVVSPPCALYRHYDDDGVLLYIGITTQIESRTRAHAKGAAWSRFVVDSRAEWFPSREAAQDAERGAIQDELPLFNGTHAPRGTKIRRAKYLAEHEAWDLLAGESVPS